MLKLLDRYYIAILSSFNKRYRFIFEIPLGMTIFISMNILSLALIFIPLASDFNRIIGMIIIWLTPAITLPMLLYIRYNNKKCISMIRKLKALPKAEVLKYRLANIAYMAASVGFAVFAANIARYYPINWDWLF